MPASSFLADLAIQGDGKIVLAGASGLQGVVMRLLPDGTPDTDFGAGGRVVIPDWALTRGTGRRPIPPVCQSSARNAWLGDPCSVVVVVLVDVVVVVLAMVMVVVVSELQ
jgi:hypothetical protein